jgi:hypothetical protein
MSATVTSRDPLPAHLQAVMRFVPTVDHSIDQQLAPQAACDK